MKYLFSLFLTTISFSIMAQSPLAAHRWEDRVLLLFAERPDAAPLTNQLQRFAKARAGMDDRKLVIYQLFPDRGLDPHGKPLPESEWRRLLAEYSLGSHHFTLILIGLDGGEKWRQYEPVTVQPLFDRIDSMPMRQSELRRENRSGGQ